jgi:hypothetical protein
MSLIIGIDPGERFTGFGILQLKRSFPYRAEIGVLDTNTTWFYRPADFLRWILEDQTPTLPAIVVCEDFRVRSQGHQSMTQAKTARLIGALQYVTERTGYKFELEPPGNPDKMLALLGLSAMMAKWKHSWPQLGSKNWQHARSGWRVLASYLMRTSPDVLQSIRIKGTSKFQARYSLYCDDTCDLWAPPARLEKP